MYFRGLGYKMIYIDREVIESIKRKANYNYPFECCGFLSGKERNQSLRIDSSHSCYNISDKPREEFLIDPLCHIRLQKSLRSKNCKILGVYHSHPNGNIELSKKDMDYFNDYNLLWFIVAISQLNESKIMIYKPIFASKKSFEICQYYIQDEKF